MYRILIALAVVGLLWGGAARCGAQESNDDDDFAREEVESFLDDSSANMPGRGPGGPSPDGPPMEGRGGGRYADRDGRGEWQRRMGGGRMHEWRERGGRGDGQHGMPPSEELQRRLREISVFLKEYEPSLAEVLSEFQQENPHSYPQRLLQLARIYGPIMEQMENDPEMAQLSLKRIRLQLRVQQSVRTLTGGADEADDTDKSQLRDRVADLFDLIMEQQQLNITRMEQRLESMDEWRSLLSERMGERWERRGEGRNKEGKADSEEEEKDEDEGRGRSRSGRGERGERSGRGSRGDMQERFQRRQQQMQRTLEEGRVNLKQWRENREQIISKRIEELLTPGAAFPWGN